MNRRTVTRAEMIALDRWAIECIGVPSIALMENAGRHCAEAVIRRYPHPTTAPDVVIAAGLGNNGGDGYVVARHLWNAGYSVRIVAPAGRESEDNGSAAALHAAALDRIGIPIATENDNAIEDAGVIVDALFGTGLRAAPREPYAATIRAINRRANVAFVVAVDIPSGLDCDTGETPGEAVIATTTVTFQYAKRGFALAKGPAHTGEVNVVDITIPRDGPGRPFAS